MVERLSSVSMIYIPSGRVKYWSVLWGSSLTLTILTFLTIRHNVWERRFVSSKVGMYYACTTFLDMCRFVKGHVLKMCYVVRGGYIVAWILRDPFPLPPISERL